MVEDPFFGDQPYNLRASAKAELLLSALNSLMAHHRRACIPFQRLLQALPNVPVTAGSLAELPMLPVQLFKLQTLSSVPQHQIYRQLTSSGTTGQRPSRIFLDRETAALQTRALVMIVKSYLGPHRLPMIIVDARDTIQNRSEFSARALGILGFSNFGRDHFYLLDEGMRVNWDGLGRFLEKHRGQKIFVFGFTFILWRYFYKAVLDEGHVLDLGESVLIHGGGWKKLHDQQVDNLTFNQLFRRHLGIRQIHNYYGMVEQVGSIYMECEKGYLHAPNYADILVRNPVTLSVVPHGERGLIQTFSTLPQSYPGNSLLTEDVGVVISEDDCPCGRYGKYFVIEGRLPAAELRGCSDTFVTNDG